MRSICTYFFLLSFLLSISAESVYAAGAAAAPASSQSSANTKKAVIVAKSALFGLGGGLVVGVASQVFKKNTKNIFLAGSLGMYAGIALGIFIISTNSSPRYDGPDTYKDLEDFQSGSLSKPEKTNTIGTIEKKAPIQVALFSTNF